MSAREVRLVCRSLLLVGTLAGTAGAALAQGFVAEEGGFRAPTGLELAQALPQFIDSGRLGELHEAWRPPVDETRKPVDPQAAQSAPAKNEDAMSTARAAMKRRQDEARQAPAVRARAEALSRMFGATAPAVEAASQDAPQAAPQDGTEDAAQVAAQPNGVDSASANAAQTASAPADSKPVAEQAAVSAAPAGGEVATGALAQPYNSADDSGSASGEPPFAIGGPLPDADAVAAAPAGPVQENDSAAASGVVTETGALGPTGAAAPEVPQRATLMPPLPERAPAFAQKTSPADASARTATSRTAKHPKPNPASIFPYQLRSFGWNTQPE